MTALCFYVEYTQHPISFWNWVVKGDVVFFYTSLYGMLIGFKNDLLPKL